MAYSHYSFRLPFCLIDSDVWDVVHDKDIGDFDEWMSGFKIEDPKRFGVRVRKLHFVKPRGTVEESHIAVVIWCHLSGS